MRYGGNTSCVEVRLDDDTLIIFDAGTGIRAGSGVAGAPGPVHAYLFLSHALGSYSRDSLFAPAYIAGTKLTILGPEHGHLTLEKRSSRARCGARIFLSPCMPWRRRSSS
jgi:hypothetical protein